MIISRILVIVRAILYVAELITTLARIMQENQLELEPILRSLVALVTSEPQEHTDSTLSMEVEDDN